MKPLSAVDRCLIKIIIMEAGKQVSASLLAVKAKIALAVLVANLNL